MLFANGLFWPALKIWFTLWWDGEQHSTRFLQWSAQSRIYQISFKKDWGERWMYLATNQVSCSPGFLLGYLEIFTGHSLMCVQQKCVQFTWDGNVQYVKLLSYCKQKCKTFEKVAMNGTSDCRLAEGEKYALFRSSLFQLVFHYWVFFCSHVYSPIKALMEHFS